MIFDKITMSAFEGTPLDNIALRDRGINFFNSFIGGIATEIGIEPTVRHGADLGYIPIVVSDACGAGHAEAGERAMASIKFMGDATMIDTQSTREHSRSADRGLTDASAARTTWFLPGFRQRQA